MIFTTPSWVPKLPDIPDNVSIPDFMFDEKYGRHALLHSKHPFVCGLTGRSYSPNETLKRIELLARALKEELGWNSGEGSEWEKVLAVFSMNSIDTITVVSSVHRLDGIVTMANAAYGVRELAHQLDSSRAKCIVTCGSLLQTAIQAANQVGIPKTRIYLLDVPGQTTDKKWPTQEFKTIDQLIALGNRLRPIQRITWTKGQGAKQCAFLCYSSGTSGLPKGVMISHRNVMANVVQITVFESKYRNSLAVNGKWTEVPPIIIEMIKNKKLLDRWDLSSVYAIFTGAAPLGAETASALQKQYPSWKIRQGYVVCSTSAHDIWLGSSGSFLPGYTARLISADGIEITSYEQPGELVVNSPTVTLGYLNNENATKEAFIEDKDGNQWLRTGDEALIRKAPSGNDHVFIVDRIKELIKVKGMQVAPAELEAHLLTHPAVADVAVIPVRNDRAGELPKAIVVKSADFISGDDKSLALDIQDHVKSHKAKHKWLQGGVEFIDAIPKSPSGKILRRQLRDRENKRKRIAKPNI
ncbi:hypothetical protein B7463_g7918, partial [Scytalidium lignicola]